MSSSDSTRPTLSVLPNGSIDIRQVPRRIQVTDSRLALVAKGFGEIRDVTLLPGVYKVHVESSVESYEQLVFLAPGRKLSISYPLHPRDVLDSPAAVPGSDAMQETMRYPLDEAVLKPAEQPSSSRLIFMATHAARGRVPIDLTSFRFLTALGEPIGRLAQESVAGKGNAFRLFVRDLPAPGVVLEGPVGTVTPQLIRMPLWCPSGWCTVVFVSANASNGVPDLNTTSVYFWRIGEHFSPENGNPAAPETLNVMRSQRLTELALHSLIGGRDLLSLKELDSEQWVKKASNPMLAILACHLLLQKKERNEPLIRALLGNLNALLPEHPDVIALRIMAQSEASPSAHVWSATWPPMVRAGFVALREKDWEHNDTIPPRSFFERVRAHLLTGGVWTRLLAEDQNIWLDRNATKAISFRRGSAEPPLADVPQPLVASAREYLRQLRLTRKDLTTADLRWTGLSARQAQALIAERPSIAETTPRVRPPSPEPCTIFLVHGLGSFRSGWSRGLERTIEAAATRFALAGRSSPAGALRFVEINYSDCMNPMLGTWRDTTAQLRAVSRLVNLPVPASLFSAPPSLDALEMLLYAGARQFRSEVVEIVTEQMAAALNAVKPGSWSVIAHSLGTPVMMEVLQAPHFGKAKALVMVANLCRLMQKLMNRDTEAVYRNRVFPSGDPTTGACEHYISCLHELDPLARSVEFDPPPSFGHGFYHSLTIPLSDVTSANVHSFEHYLHHPLIQATILRYATPSTGAGPTPEDIAEAMTAYRNEVRANPVSTPTLHALNQINAQSSATTDQIFARWSEYSALVGSQN